ncbi:glycosyltransferase family 4 protein [Gloeothece verrucosa]|uniref:Glycosyl transferase group 1 n=1 Tax=Gloeothece verrucosa (strain PCC 7822) TaxID=497965 RepID=E0UE15_GLOV7|nr:glycosyltransferase family 4 protein [Gloeothece verrucosa]ADN13019.1 glycosyl transferase group 1 [Gloeothece verrucosa PCC 7822]
MRIAQVAPLWERVPPPAYGGIELVVGLLTDELVRRGHEVTLFASGDSQTLAKLEAISPKALRNFETDVDPTHFYYLYLTLEMNRVCELSSEFDLIHSHIGFPFFPCANLTKAPTLHTIHGTIPVSEEHLWKAARQQNFISISNNQRRNDLGLNYLATVYNAINTKNFPFHPQPDKPPYLAFLGRMSPEKGPHLAVKIAKRTGLLLKMAGKIDPCDQQFFDTEVKPFIDGQQIQFLGEADHQMKCDLMGRAMATLFPITWQEPFGLVMIESMAVGTPVVAMKMGSTPEIIAHGRSGFLCNNLDECVAAVESLGEISRTDCRDHVVANFGVRQMVDGYEAAYQQLLQQKFMGDGHTKTIHQLKSFQRLSA